MKSDSMGKKAAKQIDFARKHEEDLRRLRGLRLLDDDFMQKVFEDKACTELLLQIILNRSRPESDTCKWTAGYQEFAGTFGKSGYTCC